MTVWTPAILYVHPQYLKHLVHTNQVEMFQRGRRPVPDDDPASPPIMEMCHRNAFGQEIAVSIALPIAGIFDEQSEAVKQARAHDSARQREIEGNERRRRQLRQYHDNWKHLR